MKIQVSLRKTLMIVMMFTLVTGLFFVETGGTSLSVSAEPSEERIQEIESEIEQLEGDEEATEQERQELEEEMERLESERQEKQNELESINTQIEETALEIEQKEEEIEATEEEARQKAEELEEAEERVEERDELLKTRVVSMYESGGSLSYIDVLFGSSSFGDFIQRLDFLTLITQQDNQLLEEYIADKELIEEKKEQIDQLLVELDEQMDELEALETRLANQQRHKEVQIASIEEEQEVLDEMTAEQEEEIAQIAAERSKLMSEKDEVQEELQRIEEERKQRQQAQQEQEEQGGNEGGSPATTSAGSGGGGGGELAWPVPGHGSGSPFGMRFHPIHNEYRMHNGLDFPAPGGTPIVAAESGVVTEVDYNAGGWGNYVVIDHGGGLQTLYAHIRHGGVHVSVGDSVSRGEQIAEVGTTGSSTGDHLHFEVWEGHGNAVDPAPYIQ